MFAIGAHEAVKQVRNYTGVPYWHHLKEVSDLIEQHVPQNVIDAYDLLSVAWLHDVVEDTGVTIEQIRQHFAYPVGDCVKFLTEIPMEGTRAVRKAAYKDQLAMANVGAATVKCADLISNTRDIVEKDRKFALIYLREKHDLLAVLRAKAHPAIWAVAEKCLKDSCDKLGLVLGTIVERVRIYNE